MGYQALLFCPDEKTARTVTQVLSELDFTVVPCTEPFAAVKKLMGEHFDAVVVDCDNEQNATLLFKSARNTVLNQSSLAVAVVEGQAGVAKAFRIGANLVLTKPINMEQAKGTLRVARGLLRKSEGAKPASGAVKPVAPVSAPAKPVVQAHVPSSSATPFVPPISSTPKPSPSLPLRPQIVASVPATDESDADLFEISEEVLEEIPSSSRAKPVGPISTPKITVASATEPKTVEATSKPAPVAGFGASAASAPAPAREPKPAVVTEPGASTTIAAPASSVKDVEGDPSTDNTAGAATFTFGGNVDDNKSASGGSKKALIAVAAVVLIAAGYAAWSKFGHSSEAATIPEHVATQQATTPKVAPISPSSSSSSPNPSGNSAMQTPSADSTPAVKTSGTAKTNPDTRTVASSENVPTRPGKDSGDANSSKPSASTAATDKAPATKEEAKPIVMKSSAAKAGAKTTIADAAAPILSVVAPAANGALPNLMGTQSTAPTPVLQTMSISQGVSQGLLVKKVQPPYPANAMTMHVEGAVQLLATISKTGDITAVKILSGEPQLARAAAGAVKQWKYKPYLLNGSPVEIQTQVTINFKLPH